jgi:hypothetical protein
VADKAGRNNFKVGWSMMLEPGKNDMSYKTKAFPNSAEAFEKYIKRGIAGVVFPTSFLFFRLHSRLVMGVNVK